MMRTSASMATSQERVAIMPSGARERERLQMSGQLGAFDQLAEPRVGAEVLEVAVAPEHALAVESSVERLAEPLESAIDVPLPRLGAGEVVERRGLAIAEIQRPREVL